MQSRLVEFIRTKTPKFNRELVEGLHFHRLKHVVEYMDSFIRYSCRDKTAGFLDYLGYSLPTPKEELEIETSSKSLRGMMDISRSDVFPMRISFQYHDYPPFESVIHLPIFDRGNIIHFNGTRYLVTPSLADKVISIGDNGIFVNLIIGKYNFNRLIYSVYVNDTLAPIPVVTTKIYRNASTKLESTTNARHTNIHYILCKYGLSETCRRILGFVPEIIEGPVEPKKGYVDMKSIGVPPRTFVRSSSTYIPSRVVFRIPEEQFNEEVQYVIGNVFYLIDHFPDRLTSKSLDEKGLWILLIGEIIHSGNYEIPYILDKMNAHFQDLTSPLPANITVKLKEALSQLDSGTHDSAELINANSIIDTIFIVFVHYNKWIMNASGKDIYGMKSYESEMVVMHDIVSSINRMMLAISKEEVRAENQPISLETLQSIVRQELRGRKIFSLHRNILHAASVEYSGDHIYPKFTSVVVEQSPEAINIRSGKKTRQTAKRISSPTVTAGSILGINKSSLSPLTRLNPYVSTDPETQTVLPHPTLNPLIEQLHIYLSNTDDSGEVVDGDDHDEEDDDKNPIEEFEKQYQEDNDDDKE